MGATFSLSYTLTNGTTADADEVMSNFNAIINNFTPAGMDDYSATTGEMDTTSDPYPGSVQTQATSLAGELGQLRYVLAQLTGEANWYIDPDNTIIRNLTTSAIGALSPTEGMMHFDTDVGGHKHYANAAWHILANLDEAQTFTNKTLTAPKIVTTGYIADGGGDELLSFVESSTPVNNLEVVNADTANSPTLRAVGDDTNIDLTLTAKGSGKVQLGSSIFGTPVSKNSGTNYQAATDGFVQGYLDASTDLDRGSFHAYTDATATPSTLVQQGSAFRYDAGGAYAFYSPISFFVKKDNYYRVDITDHTGTSTVTMEFVPLGG